MATGFVILSSVLGSSLMAMGAASPGFCMTLLIRLGRGLKRRADTPLRRADRGGKNLLRGPAALGAGFRQSRRNALAGMTRAPHAAHCSAQFYVTAPQTCPYLDRGGANCKLFTALQWGPAEKAQNNALSKPRLLAGSQNVLVTVPSCTTARPACRRAFGSLNFTPKRSHRRISRAPTRACRGLARSAWATEGQLRAFPPLYLDARHCPMAEWRIWTCRIRRL